MSDHATLQSDLAAYAASRLEGDALARLEEHLRSCAECREMADAIRGFAGMVREDGESMFEPHPAESDLMEFARGGTAAVPDRIAHHLRLCAPCALEVDLWKRGTLPVRDAERASPSRARMPAERAAETRAPAGRWVAPALGLAAGVILGGAAVSIWKTTVAPGAPPDAPTSQASGAPGATVGPQIVLPPMLRGEAPEVTYTMTPDQDYLVIACLATLPPGTGAEETFRYEIRDGRQAVVWSKSMTTAAIRTHLDATEVVTLLVPAGAVPAGRYEVRMTSAAPDRVLYRAALTLAGR